MVLREKLLWVVCLLLCIGLALSLSLQKWGLFLFGDVVDYTKFGTWSEAISGLATTTALIIALIGIYIQYSMSKKPLEQKEKEEETSIFVWLAAKQLFDKEGEPIG